MTTNNIRFVRKQKGFSQQKLADRIGIDVAQVSRMERGTAAVTLDRLAEIAGILEVDVSDLLQSASGTTTNAKPVKMEGASTERMREDVPVFGTALGAPRVVDGESVEQTSLNTGEVVQYVRRPVILDGKADAYGIYVQGHSMEPVHLAGDLILAETKRPARIGDDVVVYLRPLDENDDGDRARGVLLKRLVRRTASYVELEQFNPARTFRLDVDEIVRIDRVMRLSDLIG